MNANRLIGVVVFLATLAVYVATAAPEIYWEDSAEMATAAATLGIGHSPSFPLYVIAARSFVSFGWASHGAMAAWFSALLGAFAVTLVYALNLRLLRAVREQGRDDPVWPSAAAGALALAFTFAMWINSVRAEVYTLALVGGALVYLCAIAMVGCRLRDDVSTFTRLVMLGSFLLGLFAGCHSLIAAFGVPGFVLAVVLLRPRSSSVVRLVAPSIAAGLVGFSVYAFLPIRSRLNPAMDWGDPETWRGLVDAVLRRRSLTAAGLVTSEGERSATVFSIVAIEFGLAVFWLGVFGAWRLAKRSWRLFAIGVLFALPALAWCAFVLKFSLENFDARAYLLPALALWASLIAVALDLRIPKVSVRSQTLLAGFTCIAVPVLVAFPNMSSCNRGGGRYAALWGEEILRHSPYRAVVFLGTDSGLFALWYLQYGEGARPDAAVIARTTAMPSYLDQVEKRYPDLRWPSRTWLDSIVADDSNFGFRLSRFVGELVVANTNRRFVWEPSIDDAVAEKHLVPNGPVYLLAPQRLDSIPQVAVARSDSYWTAMAGYLRRTNWFATDVKSASHFTRPLYNMGLLLFQRGDVEGSKRFNERVLEIDPLSGAAFVGLGACAEKEGDFDLAWRHYRAATIVEPRYSDAWYNLARVTWYTFGNAQGAQSALACAKETEPNPSRAFAEAIATLERRIAAGLR